MSFPSSSWCLLGLSASNSGLPDARFKAGNGYIPSITRILSVPSGCFLSQAQVEANERGEPIVDIAQCTPPQLEHAPQLLEYASQLEPEPVPIDQEFEPQTERERRLLAELELLSPEQLLERARQAGFVDVDSV